MLFEIRESEVSFINLKYLPSCLFAIVPQIGQDPVLGADTSVLSHSDARIWVLSSFSIFKEPGREQRQIRVGEWGEGQDLDWVENTGPQHVACGELCFSKQSSTWNFVHSIWRGAVRCRYGRGCSCCPGTDAPRPDGPTRPSLRRAPLSCPEGAHSGGDSAALFLLQTWSRHTFWEGPDSKYSRHFFCFSSHKAAVAPIWVCLCVPKATINSVNEWVWLHSQKQGSTQLVDHSWPAPVLDHQHFLCGTFSGPCPPGGWWVAHGRKWFPFTCRCPAVLMAFTDVGVEWVNDSDFKREAEW